MTTKTNSPTPTAGPYIARDSAHTTIHADPENGIPEEWASTVHHEDDKQGPFLKVFGGSADHAIRSARFVADTLNAAASLTARVAELEGALREVVGLYRVDVIKANPQSLSYGEGVKALEAARALLGGGK